MPLLGMLHDGQREREKVQEIICKKNVSYLPLFRLEQESVRLVVYMRDRERDRERKRQRVQERDVRQIYISS